MSGTVYDVITNRIIESLNKGVVPWRVPWTTGAPKNLISKKAYRGVNVFLLNASRFTSPYWLSYRQAAIKGGQVRKGEHGTPVIFWKIGDKEKDPTQKFFILRYYTVFNATQCDGIELPVEADKLPFTPVEAAENILSHYDRGPSLVHGGDRAAYSPSQDVIVVPGKESFRTPEEYYSTLFHEQVHATGAKDRLNREGITDPIKFASHKYSYEELVAESGASFLCGEAGILDITFDNSAAYIAHWVGKLKSEPKWIVKAAGEAARAADFILQRGDYADTEQDGDDLS